MNTDVRIDRNRRTELMRAIEAELEHAYTKHGVPAWGKHEFFAVLKEEVDELWDAIKRDEPRENVLKELTQVAAMCFRWLETGDRYHGQHGPVPIRGEKPMIRSQVEAVTRAIWNGGYA